MTWRMAAALAAGGLLALPLALLLGMRVVGVLPTPATPPDVVPVLSYEQRSELATYRHSCETTSDCEPPLACLVDDRAARRHCIDSECETDLQCAEGFVCRRLYSEGRDRKPHVRLCVAQGDQAEGQPCNALPHSKRQACQSGLICYAWCGRPCRLEDPHGCPEGFVCQDGNNGPACLPDCERKACPEGQRCVGIGPKVSVCAFLHGTDCKRTACPQGQVCTYSSSSRGSTTKVWMQCVSACGETLPSCLEGQVCYDGGCRRPCHPEDHGRCGPGFTCGFYGDRWLCDPES